MSWLKRTIPVLLTLVLLAGTAFAGIVELPVDDSAGLPVPGEFQNNMTYYEDPSIQVTYERVPNSQWGCTYYVARIKVAGPTQIRSSSARGWEANGRVTGDVMAKRVNAVVACDGDFYACRSGCYLLRQGVEYKSHMDAGQDVLLIDENGDFHIILAGDKPEEMDKTVIDGKKIWNALCFGPALLIDGQKVYDPAAEQKDTKGYEPAQRIVLCQNGPLEYMIVACANYGLTLDKMTALVQELGAVQAYNLDGGNSACLYLMGRKMNNTNSTEKRPISDIIYFASAWEPDGE